MKYCVIQPYYSKNYADLDACFNSMCELMDKCDQTMDVIVLPEYCDIPVAMPNKEAFHASIAKYNSAFEQKAIALAKRCQATVFANYSYENRNSTNVIDKNGVIVGRYFKAHPAPSECRNGNAMDVDYSYEYSEPYTLTVDGVKYGFMTCYDFYMYEGFAALARKNVDVIIGCSHQRTDTHNALDVIGRFLSYNTNAYLVRSSVTLGEDSEICGCSMVVSPKGEMLADMKSKIGLTCVEFDPHEKYYKPAGFRGALKSHYEYIDEGRRPWLYRPAGSMMVASDVDMQYPRICSHRGYNSVAPENTLPAYGAAVALGAEEIEFDLWTTKDGVLVSCHDCNLDRVSTGTGNIWDYTLDELRQFDFGVKKNEAFTGLKIATFEEILKKFACTTIMNIHVKIWDFEELDPAYEKIGDLIRKYDCARHVYMMNGTPDKLAEFKKRYPEIRICMGAGKDKWKIVEKAISIGADKIQLFKPYFNQEMIDKAHEHGIMCNVFWSDDPDEACKFIDMGIDTILTNDYLRIANAVKAHVAERGIKKYYGLKKKI